MCNKLFAEKGAFSFTGKKVGKGEENVLQVICYHFLLLIYK